MQERDLERPGRLGPSAEIWSSVEYASFGAALAEAISAQGIPAAARYSIPQATYWNARTTLQRLRLRAAAYGRYPLQLAAHVRRVPAGRVSVVSTNTFYAPAVALAAARRRVPVVHWVLDLFPDVLLVAQKIRRGGTAEKMLRRSVRWTFERAAANVFLGPKLLAYAQQQFGPIPRAVVIPVGANGAPFRAQPPHDRAERHGPVRVLYSGNLGRMHDTDTIIGALAEGLPDSLHILFRGNGAGWRELEAATRDRADAAVEVGGNLPDSQWVETMRHADVALVTMRPGAEGVVMPSKTYSAMVAGQAILAVCPADSDLAATVREHQCGWVVAPGDVGGLRQTLATLARDRASVLEKRNAAWRAGHALFDQPAIAKQWVELLRRVALPSAS